MKTKTYLKGCEWCGATGRFMYCFPLNPINAPQESTSSLTNICPVCKGSGTILVTETI